MQVQFRSAYKEAKEYLSMLMGKTIVDDGFLLKKTEILERINHNLETMKVNIEGSLYRRDEYKAFKEVVKSYSEHADKAWHTYTQWKFLKNKALQIRVVYLGYRVSVTFFVPEENTDLLLEELIKEIKLVESLNPTDDKDIETILKGRDYFHQIYKLLHLSNPSTWNHVSIGKIKEIRRYVDLVEANVNLFLSQKINIQQNQKKREQELDILKAHKEKELRKINKRLQIQEHNKQLLINLSELYSKIKNDFGINHLDDKIELSNNLSQKEYTLLNLYLSHVKSFVKELTSAISILEEIKCTNSLDNIKHELGVLLRFQQRLNTILDKHQKNDVKRNEPKNRIDQLYKSTLEIIDKAAKDVSQISSLETNSLCKWYLTLDSYINNINKFKEEITEDTPQNREFLQRCAAVMGDLKNFRKKFFEVYEEKKKGKTKQSKAQKDARESRNMRIFMWGKRLFPDKMNNEDSWYVNESRIVTISHDDDIKEYLKVYAFKVRNGMNAEIEYVGAEDTDEWGWITMAQTFLPFCIRHIKTLSNGTTIYHFYTFDVVKTRHAFDFDDAITERVMWLHEKGLV